MLNSKTMSINHNLLKRKKAEPKLNPSEVLPLTSQAKQPNLTQDLQQRALYFCIRSPPLLQG